jgi:hypothetical protein
LLSAIPKGSFAALPKLPDLSQAEFPDVPYENEDGYNYDFVVFGSGNISIAVLSSIIYLS